MDPSTQLTPSDDAMVRTVADESVILDLASGKYFGLDPVGTRLWQLLSQGCSIEQACIELLGEYEVEEAQLRRDVQKLIADLLAHGLLKVA